MVEIIGILLVILAAASAVVLVMPNKINIKDPKEVAKRLLDESNIIPE